MEENEAGVVALAEGLRDLHERWTPLPWQIPFGRALFYEGKKDIGAQCGRSAGKTDVASYCAWRWAFEHPGSETYLIEPLFNQAREILWASNRIQNFGPPEWIESVNNTECRIVFKNKSFLKLEGSENTEKLRGVKPRGLVIWDELKDIRPQTIEAMDPNRARYNVPALYLGTPPFVHNHYVDIMEGLKGRDDAFWCQVSSFDNHHNDRMWLERKRAQLIAMGAEDTWLREFMAVFVKGGARSIFPQIAKHPFRPREEILPKDLNHWNLVVCADPGTASVFAVLFILWNPYQRQIIVADEIYETSMDRMRVRAIADRIDEKLEPFRACREIDFVYDSAAKWFANEMAEARPKWWWSPCDKAENGREEGIALTRELLHFERLHIAGECGKLRWEMESYIRDEEGRIPKINDHGIDCLFYGLKHIGPSIDESSPPKEKPLEEQPRAYRLEDDFKFSSEIGDEIGVSPYTGESL